MLFVNQNLVLHEEFNNNVEYITNEQKKEVFEKLNNINYINSDSIDNILEIVLMLLTTDEISQDIFLNYTKEELDEMLEKVEILLEDALINNKVNENSKLYKCQVVSKIYSVLETTDSKKIKNMPISALFF